MDTEIKLVKKPVRYLEYVIVNEMNHLLERLHNDRFVTYLDRFPPNWGAVREELNKGVLGV